MDGNLQVFSLDQPKLTDLISSTVTDSQLSPNGLYPSNHSSPGAPGDIVAGMDNVGMSYSHLSVPPDMTLQHLRSEQKTLVGSSYYDSRYPDNFFGQPAHNVDLIGDMFKTGDKSGYVDMLNSSDGIVIKKEKMDFDDQYGGMLLSPDMPYPPNTCVADWNYYNQVSNTPPSFVSPNHSYTHSMHYQTTNIPNNLNHGHPEYGLSNLDLHNQAKKITQNIIDTNWSAENLYKSPVYSNMAAESVSSGILRKRKPNTQSGNGSGPTRSRRRKTSNLGGHSKTVASILLSEQNQPVFIGKETKQNGTLDASVLDSSARDEFVTSLMNNLRTTVQFESFCLSFPRMEQTENAFKHKVAVTANLVSAADSNRICSKAFPEIHTQAAEKIVVAFKQALSKTDKKKGIEKSTSSVVECSAEMVEEQMPHSMLWVVRLNSDFLTANWEGQFVATINPVDCKLCFSIFQFSPVFSPAGVKSLNETMMSKELAQDITDNMQQFEVSRQLRLDVDLKNVRQIYLHAPNGDENEAVLILEFKTEPEFYQRWLHTSAEDKNKWQKRSSFLSGQSSPQDSGYCLYLGGLMSELNELVALIFASIPNVKEMYQEGLQYEFVRQSSDNSAQNEPFIRSTVSSSTDIRKSKHSGKKLRKSGVPLQKLRQEIVEILVHFQILDSYELENYFGLDSITQEMCNDSLGIELDDDISLCFRDYVNYRCESVRELTQILEMPVRARSSGFMESDYHPEKLGTRDIDMMTVAELIRTKCSDTVYYSFCRKEVGQLGHDRHCLHCHQCTTWKYWHCTACDKCSEGSRICQYCGHSCDMPEKCVIKPLSVYKSELETDTVSYDNVKSEWTKSLAQSDSDVVKWAPLGGDSLAINEGMMEYNTHNAMRDQLGLLNPVGFMFGQPSAARKHRRNKVRRQVSRPESEVGGPVHTTQSGSGCNLQ